MIHTKNVVYFPSINLILMRWVLLDWKRKSFFWQVVGDPSFEFVDYDGSPSYEDRNKSREVAFFEDDIPNYSNDDFQGLESRLMWSRLLRSLVPSVTCTRKKLIVYCFHFVNVSKIFILVTLRWINVHRKTDFNKWKLLTVNLIYFFLNRFQISASKKRFENLQIHMDRWDKQQNLFLSLSCRCCCCCQIST